ncbi:MAG: ATP-binding protein [Thermoguttaceae bacterium]|nr:ATP-binding protein [Thermoguttaceae bacterium]
MLANFEFESGYTAGSIQKAVDAWLRLCVPIVDDLPRVRDAMLMDLARRATAGGARVTAKEFLAAHNLAATPLSDWSTLTSNAREHFERTLRLRDIDLSQDARPKLVNQTYQRWRNNGPILVLSGEGGIGKTWLGTTLLGRATQEQEIALFIEATGNAKQDQELAAGVFWQEIVGHDHVIPFARIRQRLVSKSAIHQARTFVLLIDSVGNHTEARQLACLPWEDWGVRVVIACPPGVAQTISRAAGSNRCEVVRVPNFTMGELQRFLAPRLGDRWAKIPPDVLNTLRHPLLAAIYRVLGGQDDWQPTREYELFEAFWNRLFEEEQSEHPSDARSLRLAALSVARSAPYPWSASQLCGASSDDQCVGRLMKAGWLRSSAPDRYEVWHSRLLNWAIAEGIVEEVRTNRMPPAEAGDLIRQMIASPFASRTAFLGYAPLDVLWIALDVRQPMHGFAEEVLTAFENSGFLIKDHSESVLATLGPRIVPPLFSRLRQAAEAGNMYLASRLVAAIASAAADDMPSRAIQMLEDDSPRIQRAGMMLLNRNPAPEALNRLWELHCQGQADPTPFLTENEQSFCLYEDSYNALCACVHLNPTWLEGAIARANPAAEPVHDLAYLLAGLNDGGTLWGRCKMVLREKVPSTKDRSFATCIAQFRDTDEVEWLLQRVSRADDLVGSTALQALIRIDKRLALEHLDRLPERELYLTRNWHLAELLLHLPHEARSHLLGRLKDHPNPWQFALVFQGQENAIDLPILEFLLDALEPLLEPEPGQPEAPSGTFMLPFMLLKELNRADLVECFRRRRDTSLEHALTRWLLRQGPQQGNAVQHEKLDGLALLARMGGPGLTTVLNDWLRRGDRHGRLQAIQMAPRNPDSETLTLLAERALNQELWGTFPLEQGYAALALADSGCWRDVISYIVHWRLRCLSQVFQYHREVDRLDDRAMAAAVERVAEGKALDVGVIEALGFGHRTEFTGAMCNALQNAVPDSDTAHACVRALTHFQDHSDAAVPLLVTQLAVPSHCNNAAIALLVNGTDAALRALLVHLRHHYDHATALNLLNIDRMRDHVVPLVKQELCAEDQFGGVKRISMALDWVQDNAVVDELLSEEHVQEYLQEKAFCEEDCVWFVGTKAAAIRALGRLEPATAYTAALTAIRNEDAHDREMYPSLMVAIDSRSAVADLLEHAPREHCASVRWAIGRALAGEDCRETLQKLFASTQPADRAAACDICGFLSSSRWVVECLRTALDDPAHCVFHAAREALRRLEDRSNTRRLVDVLCNETDRCYRWALLDALIASGDTGDESQPCPAWADEVAKRIPLSMRQYLCEEIRKRRKRLLDDARYDARKMRYS